MDFPSEFYFPPYGYGGIERWLWSVARQSLQLGHSVFISGPRWRIDTLPGVMPYSQRINENNYSGFVRKYGKMDCVIGGHEYWSNDEMLKVIQKVSDRSFTFQLMTNLIYQRPMFDRKRDFLFCFSEEMRNRFIEQRPILSLCTGEGYEEDPLSKRGEGYLVWIGRMDEDKAPHYGAMVANKLKIPIYFMGKPQYQPDYMKKHEHHFNNKYVHLLGELAGKDKISVISSASTAIYTCSPQWIEAAGMIFSEYLRCGVPVAGMAWRAGTALDAAVDKTIGKTAYLREGYADEEIVKKISAAVEYCLKLNREKVYLAGNKKFSPRSLTSGYFNEVFKA